MKVGPVTAAALVAASMIGTGVFTTSGYALADLGSREAVLLAWVLGALYALAGAWSYLLLVRHLPVDGGEAALLTRTWHPAVGAAMGWVGLAAGFTAPIAAAALAMDAYIGLRIGIPAIALVALLHAIPRAGRSVQTLAVGLKALIILAGVALAWRATAPLTDPTSLGATQLGALGPTVVWVAFAYSGWNAFAYVGGQLSDGAKRAGPVLGGVAAVSMLYVLVNAAVLYAAPVSVLAGRADVAVAAVEALGVPALQAGVRPVVALALFTSIAAMVWTGAEVWRHLASDGQLPGFLRHQRTALAVQAGLAMSVASVAILRDMLGYIGLTLSVSSALTVAGLFALKARGVGRYRDLMIPSVFILATVLGSGWMAWQQPVPTAVSATTLLVAGALGWASTTFRTTRSRAPTR